MEQITIAGEIFSAPLRYTEGHVLTAEEATALNQTLHGSLRNNFMKVVKKAQENGGADVTALQAEFDKLAAEYVFGGARRRVSSTRDPIMAEAINIAKSDLKVKLLEKGINPSQVKPTALTDLARQAITKDPNYVERARRRIEEAKAAASADLDDLIAGIPMKAAS